MTKRKSSADIIFSRIRRQTLTATDVGAAIVLTSRLAGPFAWAAALPQRHPLGNPTVGPSLALQPVPYYKNSALTL